MSIGPGVKAESSKKEVVTVVMVDVIFIHSREKHWHGAVEGSMFSSFTSCPGKARLHSLKTSIMVGVRNGY